MKTVTLNCGQAIEVPDWATHVAVDDNGAAFAYGSKPTYFRTCREWLGGGENQFITRVGAKSGGENEIYEVKPC